MDIAYDVKPISYIGLSGASICNDFSLPQLRFTEALRKDTPATTSVQLGCSISRSPSFYLSRHRNTMKRLANVGLA